MDLNFTAFQEPRGVMRILHFVFSICAFATVTGYSGYIKYNCFTGEDTDVFTYPFSQPFERNYTRLNQICDIQVVFPPPSDVKFFVATGVLSMLYTLSIIVVYVKFDDLYKKDTKLPLIDFVMTVIFGVLWLSSSAAWANSLVSMKDVTNRSLTSKECIDCSIRSSNFSTLNISVILGFLNFFLWAADLWFVYKETVWFQGKQQQTSGV